MTRAQILQELSAEYKRRQILDHEEEDRKRADAEQQIPGLAQALRERQNLIYGALTGILRGKESQSDLPAQMESKNTQIAAMLKQAGYAEDWLDPVYRCPVCKDTGYYGEPIREMCSCMRTAYYERLYASVGLKNSGNESFETFDESIFPDRDLAAMGCTQRELMRMIRQYCERWVAEYPYPKQRDLLFSGKSGLGKTFLLHSMARRLLQHGVNVIIVSAYRFVEIARKVCFSRSEASEADMENLLMADVLMIDDLGTEPLIEGITIVQFFNLLNERQTAGRSTIISTNLNECELRERYTERVASRMLDKRNGKFIPFEGDDVRRL